MTKGDGMTKKVRPLLSFMAPTDILWILPDGKITIGPTQRENTGKWKIFKPKGDLKIK